MSSGSASVLEGVLYHDDGEGDTLIDLEHKVRTISGVNQAQNTSLIIQMDNSRRVKRAATSKKERIWEYGVVPYEVDPIFSGDEKVQFERAMKHWENYTCLKFVERKANEHKDFIRFTELPCGCCSPVGKQGNGGQDISIGKSCHRLGTIAHEIGHAIGFWHEHTRPDRDEYVTIISKNIQIGNEHNFNKLRIEDVDLLGEPYDHNSIMHYARTTYSRNNYDATILPKRQKNSQHVPKIGQRDRLSESDIRRANKLYHCPTCGRTFLLPKASFNSPNYYMKMRATGQHRCEWRILATHGERIQLNITALDMVTSKDCLSEYLEIRDGYWHESPLLGRLCGKSNNVSMIASTGHRMVITYVSTNSDFRGFVAKYEAVCGGDLIISKQQKSSNRIESPNYPQLYLPNKKCVWRISMPADYQVALEFYSFDLQPSDNCTRDYVEVRKGFHEKSRLIGRYCGNSLPPILASTSNQMYIKFVSDASGRGRGFAAALFQEIDECKLHKHGCEQNCINTLDGYTCTCRLGFKLRNDMKTCEVTCGGILNTSSGVIESPFFPNPYPANEECIWEIVSRIDDRITLNFTHFELEGSHLVQEECDYDSVTIFSKYSNGRVNRQAIFCSELLPPSVTSETNVMRIQFKSDKTVQKAGFSATFSITTDRCATQNGGCQHICQNTRDAVMCSCKSGFVLAENQMDCVPGGCRYDITAPQGVIMSENYPKNYSKNLDCIWHFKAIHGHRPYLEFEQFELEDDYECSNDFVAISVTVDDPLKRFYLFSDVYTLGKFCGSTLPYPIASPADDLYMAFRTDSSIQRGGFIAKHSTVCGGHFTASTSTQLIYSHAKFGDTFYDHNTTCDWIIMPKEPGQRVYLVLNDFDVEAEQACSFDFVDVYEERGNGKWSMHGRYCGDDTQLEIVAITQLLIRFRTDDTVRRKGFSFSYTIANQTVIRDYMSGSNRYNRLIDTMQVSTKRLDRQRNE